MTSTFSEGRYEPAENILHVWYPRPVYLSDESVIERFFYETLTRWIEPCPKVPYLLVNYANVSLRPDCAAAYARNIQGFQRLVLGTFRYGLGHDAQGSFTAVAVRLGNMALAAPPNIFRDEVQAREAIRRARLALP
jgi:hypothetical protein